MPSQPDWQMFYPLGGWLLLFVALGTAIDLAGRWAFALGKRAWWRVTGTRPFCLDERLARRVSLEFAEKLMANQDVPQENKPDAVRAQALLMHTAIVDYAWRWGAET